MANYQQLIYNISNYIKENHSNDITGSVLQNILLSIVSSVGGYKYMGVASTSGHPETPDYNIFYIAYSQNGGTYPYYGNITLNANELAILKYNGSWSKDSIGTISGGGSSINVVDNLTTDSGTDALSARQGMLLNNGIELINALIEQGSFLEIAQVKGNSTLQLNDFIPNSEGTLEIPIATVNGLGLVRPDGTTITVNNGVLTVIGGGGGGSVNVINNLNSTSTTDALSANMGRELNVTKKGRMQEGTPEGTTTAPVLYLGASYGADTYFDLTPNGEIDSMMIRSTPSEGEAVIKFKPALDFDISTYQPDMLKFVGYPDAWEEGHTYVLVVSYGIGVIADLGYDGGTPTPPIRD